MLLNEVQKRRKEIRGIFVEFHFFDIDIEKLKANVLDFFVARNSVALVQKILTSLNSTLAKSGQPVSGRVLASISIAAIGPSRRSCRPLLETARMTRDNSETITCSLPNFTPSLLLRSYLCYQLRARFLLIGSC